MTNTADNTMDAPLTQPVNPRAEFGELLRCYRLGKSSGIISNRFPWQTRAAALELLKLAAADRLEVRVITGSATEQFYCTDVLDAIEACAAIGVKIRFVIWNESKSHGDGLDALCKRFPEFLQLRYSGTRVNGDRIPHFMVVGESAYRLEAVHPYLDTATFSDISPETKAKICFNNTTDGNRLVTTFDAIWDLLVTGQVVDKSGKKS